MESVSIVGIGSISLGGGIQSLGDGVQTSGGSEGNSVVSDEAIISISVSGSLSVDKSVVSVSVVGIGGISLGGGIQSLGDGVQTSGGSEGDTGVSECVVGISLGLGGHNQASCEKSLDHVGSTPDTE